MKSLSHVRLFATPWTVAYQAPSMGFSRQEYWSGLPFPSPGDLPDPGIEPGSPTLQADALPSEPSLLFGTLHSNGYICIDNIWTPSTYYLVIKTQATNFFLIGKRHEQTIHKCRYTNDQHLKMFDTISLQRNTN